MEHSLSGEGIRLFCGLSKGLQALRSGATCDLFLTPSSCVMKAEGKCAGKQIVRMGVARRKSPRGAGSGSQP